MRPSTLNYFCRRTLFLNGMNKIIVDIPIRRDSISPYDLRQHIPQYKSINEDFKDLLDFRLYHNETFGKQRTIDCKFHHDFQGIPKVTLKWAVQRSKDAPYKTTHNSMHHFGLFISE